MVIDFRHTWSNLRRRQHPKAMMRSKLWSIEHHQNIDAMPTIGQIISDQTKSTGPVESREEMLKRYTPDL
jgi:hypothetical protein